MGAAAAKRKAQPTTSGTSDGKAAITKAGQSSRNTADKPAAGVARPSNSNNGGFREKARWLLASLAVLCLSYAAYVQWYARPPSSSAVPSKPARRVLEDYKPYQAPRETVLDEVLPPRRPLPEQPVRTADVPKQAAVLDAFLHSWSAYRQHAWGYDEFHPLSKHGSNLSGKLGKGIGYTIVDSLDSLIILGLDDEYQAARDWVKTELSWDVPGRLNVFETTIRTLGGLLSASALIRDPPNPAIAASEVDAELFLSKAAALAERLVPAFRTGSGVPLREVDLETGETFADVDNNNSSSLAEATTLQLEFKYLAHLLDEKFYWRLAERPMQVARFESLKTVNFRTLLPIFLNPETGHFYLSEIRLGSRGDSYYEYLVKQWLQTNRTEDVYKNMYDSAVHGIKSILVKPSLHSDPPLMHTVELAPRRDANGKVGMRLVPKQDHLVCFLGGAMMLGAVSVPEADASAIGSQAALVPPIQAGAKADEVEKEDWQLGHELIRTCVDMYQKTKTGLGAEIVFFRTPQEIEHEEDWYIKKPPPSYEGKANPLIDARNILRPETVESLFIAFHLTGDEIYREWGWEIFQAFVKHCKVESGGFASIDDVDAEEPQQLDRMETFWLSETLKYLYLLFSDQALLPLDKWVFNTEAHPLPVFTPQFPTTVE
ncbi:mannosyl-oligosaccharide alpha-1,2-mannosidase [Thecaphora frezii]